MTSTLGERLKRARKEKGLTQQQVANYLGIAKSTYCGYESNFRKPDVLTIQRVSSILEVSGNYLIGSDEAEDTSFSDVLYISRPTGDETTDELRRQLHDFIDQLSDEDLRAMSVMIKFNKD